MATQISTAQYEVETQIPSTMRAVVYHGINDMRVEAVPVPAIGRGELLVRIATCGICGTDLKKIHYGSHSAPRIFGHEMSGTVVAAGEGVTSYRVGERVEEAKKTVALALRTGTEDRDIRSHAKAIAEFAPRVAAR